MDGKQIIKDGNGQYLTYHDFNGQNIEQKVMVRDGKYDGKCEHYDMNGGKVKETFYNNGNLIEIIE